MTFTYYWKTPDNARHTGEVEAEDREKAQNVLNGQVLPFIHYGLS